MNEYKVFLSPDANYNKKDLEAALNKLKHKDSVITEKDKISVVTEYSTDIDVFVGGMEAWTQTKENHKPVLLCDIDCSKIKEIKDCTIPYTWGLFSSENKENEKKFLEYYNLSFIYGNKANVIKDYIAPLVFCMLEEFSFHDKYNKEGFGYKKQAEFIHEFTQFYLDKMKKLAGMADFVRDDIKDDIYHIIYKYRPEDENKPFYSIDGREYDFVIEYHRGKPSEGIYYGIKGEVKEGDLEDQCKKFREEWPNIFMKKHSDREYLSPLQKATTDILNDTFPWKDFFTCYKPTDNFNKKRYWLFWITLNDDEDIDSVAALAVKLISRTFNKYLWRKETFEDREKKKRKGRGRPPKWDNKDPYLRIPFFSNKAYEELCKLYSAPTGDIKPIEKWIEELKNEQIVEVDNIYEKCYKLKIELKAFVKNYIQEPDEKKTDKKKLPKIKSPFNKKIKGKNSVYYYDLLDRLFMPKDGKRYIGRFRQAGRSS